jgi:hypothetical protein
MTDYLPLLAQIEARLGLGDGARLETVESVTIDGDFLRFLVGQIAAEHAIDTQDYLEKDGISLALDWGDAASEQDHFAKIGYFAGLDACPQNFDEHWYLAAFPDARRDVSAGRFETARDHYMAKGRGECRSPNAAAADVVRDWRRTLRQPKTKNEIQLTSPQTSLQGKPT